MVAENIFFPYVKGPSSHLLQRAREEYNKIQPFAPVPPMHAWYSARQQMEYPLAVVSQSRPLKIRTAVPPPLLFFNAASPQKQRSFFYIWCCIRDHWDRHWRHANALQRDQLLLTHDQWREILSGEIFRKNTASTTPFTLATFWQSDPGIIFEPGSEHHDLTSRLRNGTPLVPEMFEDSHPAGYALKRALCYDIALTHVQFQFEQTDDAFMVASGADPNSGAMKLRLRLRRFVFRDSVRLLQYAPPWEMESLVVRSGWYERLRFFVKDWQLNRPGYLQQDISIMNEPAFSRELQTLLVVYFEGIAHFQNTVPTLMWTFPGVHGVKHFLSL